MGTYEANNKMVVEVRERSIVKIGEEYADKWKTIYKMLLSLPEDVVPRFLNFCTEEETNSIKQKTRARLALANV